VAALRVRGTIRVPGDKSISHRALMIAAMAEGESTIRDILVSGDIAATASVLREMGVELAPLSPHVTVRGRGLGGLRAPGVRLDCGNSGTTARLTAGIIAGHPFSATLIGDESLRRRPMRRVAQPLEAMGAGIEFEDEDGLPMTVRGGALRPIEWDLQTPSAQVKSAILFAALNARVTATVRGGGRSRDHTERMLAASGVEVVVDGDSVSLTPGDEPLPIDVSIPSDPSSAAYFAGLAALADEGEIELPGVGLNPTRATVFSLLAGMGVRIAAEVVAEAAGEPIGTVRVSPHELRGRTIPPEDVTELLDELPLIGCLGAVAEGETRVTGAAELRVKESDRISGVVENLRAIGAEAEEFPDGFVVRGSARPLRGTVKTRGDHRIAMAFGVLAQRPNCSIKIDDPGCVDVSYPDFWQDLRRAVGT
jgi:3-phosphoshikimate 1-carboxyvinyltransferase